MRRFVLARTALSVLLLLTSAACAAPPDATTASDGPPDASRLVQVRVVSDAETVRPGSTFHVALIFDIAPHWHVYWEDPGSAGAPTEVSVKAPAGYTVGRTLFPRPKTFAEPEGTAIGYDTRTVLFVPVTAPDTLADGSVSFAVEAFYLVCRDICLLGDLKETVTVRTSSLRASAPTPRPGRDDALLKQFRARLPEPLTNLEGATARFDGERLVVTGPLKGHGTVTLFPILCPGVDFGAAVVRTESGRFRLNVPIDIQPQNALGEPMSLRFVLALGRRLDDPSYHWMQALPSETPAGE